MKARRSPLVAVACLALPAFAAAQVQSYQQINNSAGGLGPLISPLDSFGRGVAGLGDLDGDGVADIAVGAPLDNDGGLDMGAVYVLLLDTDGTVKSSQKTVFGPPGIFAGWSVASLGDVDQDGITDLAVGVEADSTVGPGHGGVWVLFLNSDGSVRASQKIDEASGGFGDTLAHNDGFGYSVCGPGDVDGDGVQDLVVGAPDYGATLAGAVWVLFLNTDGTVRQHQRIGDLEGGGPDLAAQDRFGSGLTGLGDLDGDGVQDVAVGCMSRDVGGAVFVLFLNADGTVRDHSEIGQNPSAGIPLPHEGPGHNFGIEVEAIGDYDGDGVIDLAVGARSDDGGFSRGCFYLVLLTPQGTARACRKVSEVYGGFDGELENIDLFGYGIGALGDLNGDGNLDLAVGAPRDSDGVTLGGGLWVLFLEPMTELANAFATRNGSGCNLAGYTTLTPPVLCSLWRTSIDTVTPSALASVIAISTGGPTQGILTPWGELLCLPPFLPADVGFGLHEIAIPSDPTLIGANLCTQGATWSPSAGVLHQNAIDIQIGSF